MTAYPPFPSRRPSSLPLVVAGAAFALASYLVLERSGFFTPAPVAEPRAITPRGELAGMEQTFVDVFARCSPSVAHINTSSLVRTGEGRVAKQHGSGSGFVWDRSGTVVTNHHVVENARVVQVSVGGRNFRADVLASSPAHDLAVLRLRGGVADLVPLAVGSSADLKVGQTAIAIGNPFGFVLDNTEPSVTAGVISATGRNLTARSEGGGVYVDMIQTDASINPGNSGGPLVNALGEVIGVNSSIYSPTGSSVGLGFAIPIDRARRVADDLIAHGKARQPWIGVRLGEAPAAGTERTGTPRRGAVVSQVTPESPAASVGIRVGDVIVRSRERTLRNAYDWEAEQLELRVGERVPLTIRRGTRELDVTVTVADRPEVTAERVSVLRDIELVDVTAAIRAEHSIRNSGGALIVTVAARVSETLGVQAGDVIVQVMNTPIRDARHAKQVLEAYSGRGRLRMFVERGGQIFSTDFQIR